MFHLYKSRLLNYNLDDRTLDPGCKKEFPMLKVLSPGMIVMYCRHGIYSDFKIRTSGESTLILFNILMTHYPNTS